MAFEPIIEQLKDSCDCVEVKELDVVDLINVISMATCWTQEPCETFLNSKRKELIELPDCLEDCDVFHFIPFYHPYDSDSFTFTLIEIEGVDEKQFPIADYVYSEIMGEFRLNLPLESCLCKKKGCGCEAKYYLLVEYFAGYNEIPDCLLPIFCEILKLIKDKNECDCDNCQTCQKSSDDLVQIYANGDVISPELDNFWAEMLKKQYQRQLSMLSLCQAPEELWGFVV